MKLAFAACAVFMSTMTSWAGAEERVPFKNPGEKDAVLQQSESDVRSQITVRMVVDGNGNVVEETFQDGRRHVLVIDREGNVVFKGDANTDEERAKLPASILEKMKEVESERRRVNGDRMPRIRMEKVAFLGVVVSPIPELLRERLKLPSGVGVMLDYVEEGSPAGIAGFRRGDVLRKWDDQILVNPPQLATLVRLRKAGDDVSVTFLRGEKEESVTVRLAEKEIRTREVFDPLALERQLIRAAADRQRARASAGGFTFVDPDGNLFQVSDEGGQRRLSIKNREGKTVFDGPVNTEEERGLLPAEVLEKLEKFESAMKAVPASSEKSEPKK